LDPKRAAIISNLLTVRDGDQVYNTYNADGNAKRSDEKKTGYQFAGNFRLLNHFFILASPFAESVAF
jgi:hypothetical protein